jgi:hypothetical protein
MECVLRTDPSIKGFDPVFVAPEPSVTQSRFEGGVCVVAFATCFSFGHSHAPVWRHPRLDAATTTTE